MPFAICRLSVVAVRREADLTSEMTSQVRGGEGVEILETVGQWWRASLLADGYEGWVNSRQFSAPGDAMPVAASVFTDDLCGSAIRDNRRIAVPLGSALPGFLDGKFTLGGEAWEWNGAVRSVPAGVPDKASLLTYAKRFLSAPYLWGGRTVFGIDCSGFVQSVMAAFGVGLPRDSKLQAMQGDFIASRATSVPGDLAFFGSPELGIYHVGLLLPCGEIIHASSMVRVDDMTDEGIRNRETGEITHRTVEFRRVL